MLEVGTIQHVVAISLNTNKHKISLLRLHYHIIKSIDEAHIKKNMVIPLKRIIFFKTQPRENKITQ